MPGCHSCRTHPPHAQPACLHLHMPSLAYGVWPIRRRPLRGGRGCKSPNTRSRYRLCLVAAAASLPPPLLGAPLAHTRLCALCLLCLLGARPLLAVGCVWGGRQCQSRAASCLGWLCCCCLGPGSSLGLGVGRLPALASAFGLVLSGWCCCPAGRRSKAGGRAVCKGSIRLHKQATTMEDTVWEGGVRPGHALAVLCQADAYSPSLPPPLCLLPLALTASCCMWLLPTLHNPRCNAIL